MTTPDIIEVNESNFDYQVIAYSQNVPVLVEFWAEWCDPCQRMSVVLEQEARRNHGHFRLAKVNVDENIDLTKRYQVQTVPAQRVFQDGRLVGKLDGSKTTTQVIDFIQKMIPGPESLLVEKAQNLFAAKEYDRVIETCLEILETLPGHPRTTLILIESYLFQGQPEQAQKLLTRFPPSLEYRKVEKLQPLVRALMEIDQEPSSGADKLEAIYRRALRLVVLGNHPAALDGLLDVLRENKAYKDGQVKEIVLGLFELLGDDNQLTKEYRPRLANILF